MYARAGGVVLVLLALVGATFLTGMGATVASAAVSTGHPGAAPMEAVADYTSENWAGYFAQNTAGSVNHTVTSVSGTWVQPAVNCANGKTAIMVMWVGIDGATDLTVEQTGSLAQCVAGVASYYVWWELYPKNAIQEIKTITVHAGDTITGSVTYSSATKKFTMEVADGASTFSKTATQKGTLRNSAECIVERPGKSATALYSLAKFTTASFSSCTATISGSSGAIGTFPQVGSITMLGNNDKTVIAETSALTSNTAFTVTWKGYS